MKKYLSLIIATLTLFVVSAQANLVTINWAPNHSPSGGEFVLTPDTGTAFNTFCIERNQFINVGGTYSYQISSTSDGGINGPAPVSLGTAWLYSQFLNGTLSGFAGSTGQQTDLQNAIWYCQGELSSIVNNPYVTLAQSTLNANILANGNGAYGVDVWNLFDANGNQCQSQLGVQSRSTSVPEAATWWVGLAILLPFGLSTMKTFRNTVAA